MILNTKYKTTLCRNYEMSTVSHFIPLFYHNHKFSPFDAPNFAS
jgi:hypothetical protein